MPKLLTVPSRFASQDATILGAHAHLIERLTANKPRHLNPTYRVDVDDLNERAEHLRQLLIAVTDYVGAAVTDIADCSNSIDKKYLFGCLNDLTGDIVGTLHHAADDIRDAA